MDDKKEKNVVKKDYKICFIRLKLIFYTKFDNFVILIELRNIIQWCIDRVW